MRNSGVERRKGEFSRRREEEGEKFWCREEEGLSSLGEERRKMRVILVQGGERVSSLGEERRKTRENLGWGEERVKFS